MGSHTHYRLIPEIRRPGQIENDGHIISIIGGVKRR
jgi:hypothetical protein